MALGHARAGIHPHEPVGRRVLDRVQGQRRARARLLVLPELRDAVRTTGAEIVFLQDVLGARVLYG